MNDERRVLPVLPLRGLVLFPGHSTTVSVSRPIALKALEVAMRGDRLIFAVSERASSGEPSCDTLYPMGVLARVQQIQMTISALQAVVSGEQRATAVDYRPGEYLSAVTVPVQPIPPVNPQDAAFVALYREVRQRATELGIQRGLAPEVLSGLVASVNDPGDFCDLVAHYLEIDAGEKQQLLETLGVEMRLRRTLLIIQRELDLASAQEEIKNKVAQELGGRQREFYLREQLKAIRRELGESGDKDDARAGSEVASVATPGGSEERSGPGARSPRPHQRRVDGGSGDPQLLAVDLGAALARAVRRSARPDGGGRRTGPRSLRVTRREGSRTGVLVGAFAERAPVAGG